MIYARSPGVALQRVHGAPGELVEAAYYYYYYHHYYNDCYLVVYGITTCITIISSY